MSQKVTSDQNTENMDTFYLETKIKQRHIPVFFATMLLALLVTTTPAKANENPDELYRQGRFAEAEKAYASADMDRPKDIRFRYNRGCAAFQNSDYEAATASFSSVLRRAEDTETQFKAVFNLGNTAFKQGDLSAAANYYKQAILYNPQSSDARHNLELTLREMKKQKENKQKSPDSKDQSQSNSSQNHEGQQHGDTERKSPDKGSDGSDGKDASEKGPPENQEQKAQKDQSDQGHDNKPNQQAQSKDSMVKGKEPSQEDLSGKLEPKGAISEQEKENGELESVSSMIDRKKAEALLDNIQENPSRFLQYQVPPEKRQSVSSGKDW